MAQVNITRKITTKQLVGNVKEHIKPLKNGETVALSRVIGIASGTKEGETSFGPYIALTGEFMAESLIGDKVGNRYRSGTIFLPGVALDLVLPAVAGLEKGEGCELAFEILAEADDTSNTGYVYGARFLVEPDQATDPLMQLAAKALPAPKK